MQTPTDIAGSKGLTLVRGADGLALVGDGMSVRGDFSRLLPRIRTGNLNRELLVKAAKVKTATAAAAAEIGGRLTAVDATAGLGDDSFLLAAAGFHVTLFERNPVIAALLADALTRAENDPALTPIAERMQLVEGESTTALPRLGFTPDVVLLDPMFPAKGKDAAAKKKLQMLQKLEKPCTDEAVLLEAACAAHPRKVIVKRPVKGPCLASRKPSYSLKGKAIRYDVYALA